MLFNNTVSTTSDLAPSDNTLLFGIFALDMDRGTLYRNGAEVALRPKSFKVLEYLVTHSGILICKNELLDAVWPDVIVTEDSLTQCLLDVRKALRDRKKDIVRTFPRRGYIFDLPVSSPELQEEPVVRSRARNWVSPKRPSVLSVITAFAVVAVVATGLWESHLLQVINQPSNQQLTDSTVAAAQQQATAIQHYERGMFYHGRRAQGDLDRAIAEFQKTVAIDPKHADAWAGMAGSVYVKSFDDGSLIFAENADYKILLNRAISIDPNNPNALIRLSDHYYCQNNYDKAQMYLDKALMYGRDVPLVLAIAARNLTKQLRYDEAIDLQRHAVELEPLSVVQHNLLAHFLFISGRLDEARAELIVTMDLQAIPDKHSMQKIVDINLLQKEYKTADQWIQKLSDSPQKFMSKAIVHHANGRFQDSARELQKLQTDPDIDAAFRLAEYYTFLRNSDEAFLWLSKFSDRLTLLENIDNSTYHMEDLQESQYLQPLRDDPRWDEWQFKTKALVSASLKPTLAANL